MRHLPLAGALAVGIAALVVAGPASAHVTVNPNTATQGGYAKLTFRVPTESDTASTTSVQITIPAEAALKSVSVKPHAGWTYQTVKSGDTVTEIDWTADSAATAIKPGEFDEFDISVGPLPKVDSLQFKALQTYSDGSVVRWIEPRITGQAEPEHPAPTLTLTAATSGSDTGHDTAASATNDDASTGDGKTTTALVLSIVALVLALAGGGVALLRRKPAA